MENRIEVTQKTKNRTTMSPKYRLLDTYLKKKENTNVKIHVPSMIIGPYLQWLMDVSNLSR